MAEPGCKHLFLDILNIGRSYQCFNNITFLFFFRTNLKLKEDVKSEKKSGFWDSLVIKQNIQSRKPDEIEGWEPPQITAGEPVSDAANTLSDYTSWSGWEDETKGSTKYTNLASSGNSSRWSIKSAGKLVSIRRQSKGNLTDNWEELE